MRDAGELLLFSNAGSSTAIMLQGPPGTGKSDTIVSMAAAFLAAASPAHGPPGQASSTSRPRLLVCAQSNAAVDELVLRFSKGVPDGASSQPRCALFSFPCHSASTGHLGVCMHACGQA
jgi:hypothetical protein